MILTHERVISYLNIFEKESKAIKEDLLEICWHMRGGISYDEAMLLSDFEREVIRKIIKNNAEITNKTGLPHF